MEYTDTNKEIARLAHLIEGNPGDVKLLKQEYQELAGKRYAPKREPLTSEEKFNRVIRKLIRKLPNIPIAFDQNYGRLKGKVCIYGKKYIASFWSHNGDEWYAHGFHIRRYNDHTDLMTDYFAGTYVDNLKQLIDYFTSWEK